MSEKVATPIVANTKIARTRAAERMRRCRQRRRDGLRCYRLELHDSEIEALVRRGVLRPKRPIGTPSPRRCMRSSTAPLGARRDAQRSACDAPRKAVSRYAADIQYANIL